MFAVRHVAKEDVAKYDGRELNNFDNCRFPDSHHITAAEYRGRRIAIYYDSTVTLGCNMVESVSPIAVLYLVLKFAC